MGRLLAIDYGTKRCGIAETDPLQLIASGLTTVDASQLMDFLKNYIQENTVEALVVGLPTRHDGSLSEVNKDIDVFIQQFNEAFPQIEVKRQDERFTSKMAVQTMIAGGMKKSQRRNKAMVDQISATIILQDYMQNQAQ